MGQAKNRGTYIERRNMAIHRAEQARIIREQEKRIKIVKTSAKTLLLASLLAGSYHYFK